MRSSGPRYATVSIPRCGWRRERGFGGGSSATHQLFHRSDGPHRSSGISIAIAFYTGKLSPDYCHFLPVRPSMQPRTIPTTARTTQRSTRLLAVVLTSALLAACASSEPDGDTGTGGAA